LRSHLHNVDRLLQLQRCRLTCLEEAFDAQLQALKLEFEAERRTILEQYKRESRYLQDMALAADQNYAEKDHEVTLNFQSARDDIKNKSLKEKQYSHMHLGGKAEALWEQLQQAMQSYAEATEHQKITFKALKQKDEKSSREIEMQAKKLQKLQDLITATKGRIKAHLQMREEQIRYAREEKERVLRQLQDLKSEMNRARVKAHGSLARLTVQSSAALKTLAQVVEKAQQILRLAEMCHRLETEEEKVLPFYTSSLAEEEQRDACRALKDPPVEPLAWTMQDYMGLEHFWQQFSKAQLEEQALEQEREALSKRNRCLRELLRQYLAGISITQEVLSEPSLLLAVQHKSSIPRDLPCTEVGREKVTRAPQTPTAPWTLSPAPLAPSENPPADRGRHRDHDCLEVS
ncbi:PREDICTED: coiled-coil domain-containing protein 65, partial [Chlamydotis macqueenii]